MKKYFTLTTAIISLGVATALAQFGPRGGGPQGPNLGGSVNKLFGANQTFSAVLEFQSNGNGTAVTMPGKIMFDNGKSRFEMNMSEVKGSQMPAGASEHLKAMGMDAMVSISRPDQKLAYIVYPGLNSYATVTNNDPSESASPDDFKVGTEKLGSETVDGHDCVKNQVTVTDKDNNKNVSTVWNATDLKNFPVQIVSTNQGTQVTMVFKNIAFNKPAASNFDPPSDFTKYDDVQTMMRTEMMKKMGSMAMPPH